MISAKDFPEDGFYWVDLHNNEPGDVCGSITIVLVDTGSVHRATEPRGEPIKFITQMGMASGRPLAFPVWLAAWGGRVKRVKLINPAVDPFAPEFPLTIRRGAEGCQLAGRVVVDIAVGGLEGARRTLMLMEAQANAQGGPLRVWIDDTAAPVAPPAPHATAPDVPAGAKRTGRAEDATGDEWEGGQ